MNMRYVTFNEAMKAVKEGILVRFYDSEGYYTDVTDFNFPLYDFSLEDYSLRELIEGKWTIEY